MSSAITSIQVNLKDAFTGKAGKVSGASKGMAVSLGRTRNEMRNLNRAGSNSLKLFDGMTKSLLQFGSASVGGFAIIDDLMRVERQLVAIRSSYATIFSDNKAAEELGHIEKLADRLGIDVLKLQRGFGLFTVAGQDAGLELSDIKESFKNVTEAMRAFGLGAYESENAIIALKQIASKGVVSMEELRQQLGEKIPNVFGAGARSLGLDIGEFIAKVGRGEVASKDFLLGFSRELNKFAAPGLEKALNSIPKYLGNIGNGFTYLKRAALDSGLRDIFLDGAKSFSAFVNSADLRSIVGGIAGVAKSLWPIVKIAGPLLLGLTTSVALWTAKAAKATGDYHINAVAAAKAVERTAKAEAKITAAIGARAKAPAKVSANQFKAANFGERYNDRKKAVTANFAKGRASIAAGVNKVKGGIRGVSDTVTGISVVATTKANKALRATAAATKMAWHNTKNWQTSIFKIAGPIENILTKWVNIRLNIIKTAYVSSGKLLKSAKDLNISWSAVAKTMKVIPGKILGGIISATSLATMGTFSLAGAWKAVKVAIAGVGKRILIALAPLFTIKAALAVAFLPLVAVGTILFKMRDNFVSIGGEATKISTILKATFGTFKELLFGDLIGKFSAGADGMKKSYVGVVKQIRTAFKSFFTDFHKKVVNFTKPLIFGFLVARKMAGSIGERLLAFGKSLTSGFGSFFSDVSTNIKEVFGKGFGSVLHMVVKLSLAMNEAFSGAGAILMKSFRPFIDGFSNLINAWKAALKGNFTKAGDFSEAMTESFAGIGVGIVEEVKKSAGNIKTIVGEDEEQTKTRLSAKSDELVSMAKFAASAMKSAFKTVAEDNGVDFKGTEKEASRLANIIGMKIENNIKKLNKKSIKEDKDAGKAGSTAGKPYEQSFASAVIFGSSAAVEAITKAQLALRGTNSNDPQIKALDNNKKSVDRNSQKIEKLTNTIARLPKGGGGSRGEFIA